ncbi:MAG: type II secretion system protein [Patescibacteria group bacterium]|jgi:prepilin-type N-terminal cleavage/methylation domain-containing protein
MFKQKFSSLLNLSKFKRGFTLIELLVVISIIGFLTVASVVVFNIVRMNARDAVRVGNVATITRALAMYLNDSSAGYPASTGECLSASSGVGAALQNSKVLLDVPADPLWAASAPNPTPNITPPYTSDADGFCYYYVSTSNKEFELYYFLESNSKSGSAGPNLRTQ